MNLYLLITILSYTIAPAAIIAIKKQRQCRATYLPFFIYLLAATANEIISTIIIERGYSNSINSNIYTLIESLLLIWMFQRWSAGKKRGIYVFLIILIITVWILDSFIVGSIKQFNCIHRAAYAFMVVMLCGDQLTYIMFNDSHVLRNPRFIICVAFLIKYTYKTFSETLMAFDPGFSNNFYQGFMFIWVLINAATNLTYILAVIWIPRKERFYITYY